MDKNKKQTLSNTELASFCSQISAVLKAGISPGEGIAIMLEDTASPEEKEILTAIQDTLNATGMFGTALKDTEVFPDYMLNMIELGEQTGRLDDVMESLSVYYEREANLAAAIKSAVTYPCIMIGMMILVVAVLLTKVLPVFNQVFAQFGSSMNGVSKALMNAGTAMNRYSVVFLIILALLAGVFLYFFRTTSGRKASARYFSRLKLTQAFCHKNAACRFAGGMALALKSGLTFEDSLELSGRLTTNPVFQEKVSKCTAMVSEGIPLAKALTQSGIFTGIHARMLLVGDRTGFLDDAMQKIASQYETELDDSLGNTIAVIEPTLVAVLSIIVGLILLSVMMPLMGILSGM